jgi:thymidylate synthase (FAD)
MTDIDRDRQVTGQPPGERRPTLRPTVEAMENILGREFPVLDHGFVRVVDYMGNDDAVVQAARVSFGKGTKSTREDAALIRYLMRQGHTTPFEMCEIKLHVKLPIFVARQWIRHRTANVNEYSARYSILDREFYLPAPEHIAAQSRDNRQGRGGAISPPQANKILQILRSDADRSYARYRELLNQDDQGQPLDPNAPSLARELARINLTLNVYTQWYWKIDLHNLLHFLRLRADRHAQLEIRSYADKILEIVQLWVPHTFSAFSDCRLQGVELSSAAVKVIRRLLSGEKVSQQTSGLTRREWDELCGTFLN